MTTKESKLTDDQLKYWRNKFKVAIRDRLREKTFSESVPLYREFYIENSTIQDMDKEDRIAILKEYGHALTELLQEGYFRRAYIKCGRKYGQGDKEIYYIGEMKLANECTVE